MYGRNEILRTTKKFRRILALGIAIAMLCCMLPMHVAAFALATPSDIPTDHVQEDSSPLCTCENRCTDESINSGCPVCSADHTACAGTKQPTAALPEYELEERELGKEAEDGARIKVSGLLPATAVLAVTAVPIEDVAEFVSEGARVLFAYDIKIMLPGDPEPTEYQPDSENPLTVTITPPQPIEAPAVEVLHIAEDTETGETTPQTVQNVVTTAEGAVEFAADGFSVYVVTIGTITTTVTFDYDDDSLNVSYSTNNVDFYPLNGAQNNAVALSSSVTELYFKITGSESIHVWSDGQEITAESGDTYTLSDITTNTYIDIDKKIEFDLSKETVNIGSTYSGTNCRDQHITGSHHNGNKYMVSQSSSTVTDNKITLVGHTGVPTYDVTLKNINCASDANKTSGGIYAKALAGTPMNIILRLEGSNAVGRIHYATGDAGATSASSLKITSASRDGLTEGSLTAYSSVTWSAAIGGIDTTTEEASRNITIAGGTITATALSTAAIGGGGNGYSDVTITGGNITATNNGTGATIGGGGGLGLTGGGGYVNISGGIVNATNRSTNGVAIGGGSSDSANGSMAVVTISGGTVITTGSIGGGNSLQRTGGTADITISGGTISAANISGGHGAGGSHSGGTLNITGGSVKADHVCNQLSINGGNNILPYTVAVKNGSGYPVAYAPVTEIEFDPSLDSYGLNDVKTDGNGKLYLWLPSGTGVARVKANDTWYETGIVQQSASITAPSGTILIGTELTADLSGAVASTSTYQWQRYTHGSWVEIDGATDQNYTVQAADAGNQLLVVINGSVYSPSVTVAAPTFTVTIPESVSMNDNDNTFNIIGSLTSFPAAYSLTVNVSPGEGDFKLALTDATTNTLEYTLYTDTARNNSLGIGGTAATFTGNGTNTTLIYYSIIGTPTYSGTYTDTLTFTVIFNSGS